MPDRPIVSGLYEALLPVADLKRSIAFYTDVVGLELATVIENRRVAFFWIGGKHHSMLGVWETGSAPMKMHLHIALRMSLDDVLASADHMRSKGILPVGFHGEPDGGAVVIGWMPAVSQYFADPDGHSIEYICVLDDAPEPAFGIKPYADWVSRAR